MSLKSRDPHDAQREAARRGKSDRRRHEGAKALRAIFGSKDGSMTSLKRRRRQSEEIRLALLRKSANGKVME